MCLTPCQGKESNQNLQNYMQQKHFFSVSLSSDRKVNKEKHFTLNDVNDQQIICSYRYRKRIGHFRHFFGSHTLTSQYLRNDLLIHRNRALRDTANLPHPTTPPFSISANLAVSSLRHSSPWFFRICCWNWSSTWKASRDHQQLVPQHHTVKRIKVKRIKNASYIQIDACQIDNVNLAFFLLTSLYIGLSDFLCAFVSI